MLYGTLAEIFARETGFNKGLGGSMHAFFPPFGIYPNNAIVGGSGDIAVGAALFKHVNRKPGIVIANIGDASMGCGRLGRHDARRHGPVRTLWDEEIGGGPPMIFNFVNNFYGMGGQPVGETMGFDVLARVGAGVNPEPCTPSASTATTRWPWPTPSSARRRSSQEGDGPVLLDTITYRFSGHSPSDAIGLPHQGRDGALARSRTAIIGFGELPHGQRHLSDDGRLDAVSTETCGATAQGD